MFVLIHGAGDVGWSWHLVEDELRRRGHRTVAPDLPCEDDALGLDGWAGSVVAAVEHAAGGVPPHDVVVVGHSYGGFTAALVAERLDASLLVYLAGMVPEPGEAPGSWWANTGYAPAAAEQAARDGGVTGNDDPFVTYYNGVPRALAEEAQRRSRGQSATPDGQPWPLDHLPAMRTRFLLCEDDHFFPADFFRRIVPERLGIEPDSVPGCHVAALSHPRQLAERLIELWADG